MCKEFCSGNSVIARGDETLSVRVKQTNGDSAVPWPAIIHKEMLDVEQHLADIISSNVPAIFQIAEHLLSAGGKRLRPGLVALAAKAAGGNYDYERVVKVGAATELIHMATLVHDDVIDQTTVRRGRATVNSYWGNKISVLSGDHLLSKAVWILSCDGDIDILETIASMTVALSESEVLQAVCEGDILLWRRHYLEIVRGKTASFLAACCKSGAIISGASTDVQEALYNFGMQLGIAFQITDDLLDIAGSPSVTGKHLGTDIREGKYTLPLLILLDNASSDVRDSLLKIITKGSISDADIATICETAHSTGAVQKAQESAASYVAKAIESISSLDAGDARLALESVATGIVRRNS